MRLFVIGGILLVVPLILIISADSVCTGEPLLSDSSTIRIIDTIFPYPMLAGGRLIGYGIKKLQTLSKKNLKMKKMFRLSKHSEN